MTEAKTTTTTRNNPTLQERIDVIDWLRARRDPIIAETKVAAAAYVSEQSGVTISASQLDYIMDQLPKLKLADKFLIGSNNATETQRRLAACETQIAELRNVTQTLIERVYKDAKEASETEEDSRAEGTSEEVSEDSHATAESV